MNRRAFTILETTIALAILVAGIAILTSGYGSAVFMTHDADNVRMATMLAEEKLIEAQLELEREGWTTRDVNKDGDFGNLGREDFRGSENHDFDDLKDQLENYKWAYTVRKIELQIPTDLQSMAGNLADGGYYGDQQTNNLQDNTFDLGDLGITPEKISDHLSNYMREVRVRVWWGEDEKDTESQVELLTHVINPSGMVTDPDAEEGQNGGVQ